MRVHSVNATGSATVTRANSSLLQSIWRRAKQWRHVHLGPVRFSYKFSRRPRLRLPFDRPNMQAIDPATFNDNKSITANQRLDERQDQLGPAIVVGAGPGLSNSLAQLLTELGHPVAVVSRSEQAVTETARRLCNVGGVARAYACDVTDERAVTKMMRQVDSELGMPELVVYAVQSFARGTLITTEACAFEESWRANCYGAFLVSREAARRMVKKARGSILLAGATSSTRGRNGYINLAVGKFGLRGLAQVMATELGPQGVHVAHVVIDGDIAECEGDDVCAQIDPVELAQTFYMLHRQPRSCWTSEMDVRPSSENFWQHC